MKKRIISALIILTMILILPLDVIAHPGRTDSSGGHKDNNNKSGLGSYHYHCGGHPPHLHSNGACPYSPSGNSNQTKQMPAIVYPSKVNFENILKEISIGDSHIVKGYVYPSNANDKSFTWKSSDETIATVDSNGQIIGVRAGTVTISAITSNDKVSAFNVKIIEVVAKSIAIDSEINTMNINDTARLTATIAPENTTNKDITWISSDEAIATIDSSGQIRGMGAGTVTISAISSNDKVSAVSVEIFEVIATGIVIDNKIDVISIGDTTKLSATITPANATYKDIVWKSSNIKTATIDNEGNLVALDTGKTTISAMQKDIQTSFELAVKQIEADSIRIIPPLDKLNAGNSLLLDVEIIPQNTFDQTIKWEVSDGSIATIEGNTLLAHKSGKIIISATSSNGKNDTIEIEVDSNSWWRKFFSFTQK
ncbi:MAG: Ig-like domain-containing protein [Eubacteriaceae bacterium]|nr:Ig-like domain-containing protein [Eubacteriaceae bacterium]